MVRGTSDYILRVIWITVCIIWIQAARCVCVQCSWKTYGQILMKFSGYVWKGNRMKWLNFGSDPDHYIDLLEPWNVIFKDRHLKKLWMDCDDNFSKWPKWYKEQVITFWSDLDHLDPGCNRILGWILMIFLGYVTNGKRKKWFNFASDLDHCLIFWIHEI